MSLRIGKYMRFALMTDDRVRRLTQGRVFPVLAPQTGETPLPYVVFAMDSMTEASTKDGLAYDTTLESVIVAGRTLDEVERLADCVRLAFMRAWPLWNRDPDLNEVEGDKEPPFWIADQTLSAGQEDYDVQRDAYFMTLSLTIETDKNDNYYKENYYEDEEEEQL